MNDSKEQFLIEELHSPEVKFQNRSSQLSTIFLDDEFKISISKNSEIYDVELDLGEWLIELTAFLKSEETERNTVLSISGDRFRAWRENGLVYLEIFDLRSMQVRTISGSYDCFLSFHARLRGLLYKAINKNNITIKDEDAISI